MINHFIGIGGGGSNILLSLFSKYPTGIFTMISDPNRENVPEKIHLIQYIKTSLIPTIRVYPNDVEDVEMYKNLFLPPELIQRINKDQNIILISSLGGFTGTILLDSLMELLSENKMKYSVFCGWPLKFEGSGRLNSAIKFRLKHLATNKVFHFNTIVDETYEEWDSTLGNYMNSLNSQIANSIIKRISS